MTEQSRARDEALTREQIEIMRGLWLSESDAVSAKYPPVILEEVRRQANALCDMALASLSETPTLDELRVAIGNAENKLRSLGQTFNGLNFTDRYGDGPHCIQLADALRDTMKEIK